MAQRHVCNGCGNTFNPSDLHAVGASRATFPGEGQKAGALATDEDVQGELCDPCWMTVKDFIGDTSADVAEIARVQIAPVAA